VELAAASTEPAVPTVMSFPPLLPSMPVALDSTVVEVLLIWARQP